MFPVILPPTFTPSEPDQPATCRHCGGVDPLDEENDDSLSISAAGIFLLMILLALLLVTFIVTMAQWTGGHETLWNVVKGHYYWLRELAGRLW